MGLIIKIKKVIHSVIFLIINSNNLIKKWVLKNVFFSNFVEIDPKLTFRKNFPENQEFVFIQIGGNDGVSFDFLYKEVLSRNAKGLIVEPSPKYFNDLDRNYKKNPNIYLVNKAIYSIDTSINLYEVNEQGLKKIPEWGKGVGSLDKNHLSSKGLSEDDIKIISVEGITFMNLLKLYPYFYDVNYLQIDTEGYDFEILKLLDFSKFSCDFIKYEKANLSHSDLEKSEMLLKKVGFNIIGDNYDNYCFKSNLSFQLKYRKR